MPPKCGRGSSSAAGRQGSCEDGKHPFCEESRRGLDQGHVFGYVVPSRDFPLVVLFLCMYGLEVFLCVVCFVLCAVCCVLCGFVARLNKTTLLILGIGVRI